MKYRLLVAMVFFMLPGMSGLSADVYKWKDAQGNTHFGNRPPSDGRDVRMLFKEVVTDSAATQPATGSGGERKDIETVLNEFEEERLREQEEQRTRSETVRRPAPTRADIVGREKERLEKKIQELEKQPLDFFGSQKNKRVRIGYYEYRLQTLMTDPDEYFNEPEKFEGNIKEDPAPPTK